MTKLWVETFDVHRNLRPHRNFQYRVERAGHNSSPFTYIADICVTRFLTRYSYKNLADGFWMFCFTHC